MFKANDRVEILTLFFPGRVAEKPEWTPGTFVDYAPELGGAPRSSVAVRRDDGYGTARIDRAYTIDVKRCRLLRRRGPIPEEHRALSHGVLKW